MPIYHVSSAVDTGQVKQLTSKDGQPYQLKIYGVSFAELPGQVIEVARSSRQPAPQPGGTLDGTIERTKAGQVYFRQTPANGGWQNKGTQTQRVGGGTASTDKAIMAQVALKAAIEMSVAGQKWDPQTVDSYATSFMETMLRLSGLNVDAVVSQQPVVQQQAMPMQPVNGGFAQPQYQQPQMALAGNGFSTEDIPF